MAEPRTTIILKRSENCWIAHHEGDRADELQELFGTTDIPTAFTEKADPEIVLAEIRRLNPGADVRLAEVD
jgi:hypothetical protein